MERRPTRLVGTVTTATTPQISSPPIVAVPSFTAWVDGPSCEIALRMPISRSRRTAGLPAAIATRKVRPPTARA